MVKECRLLSNEDILRKNTKEQCMNEELKVLKCIRAFQLQFRTQDDLFIVALIYLKRLFNGVKEKLNQLHILRFIQNSPNSFDWVKEKEITKFKSTSLHDKISHKLAKRVKNAPTFYEVGINFGEYFPSNDKSIKETDEIDRGSVKSDRSCKFEQVCDELDYE
jgi:hypothetical protein